MSATKRNPGRPKIVDDSPRRPEKWESPEFAKQVDGILAAVEAPAVDRSVRLFFQRMLYRGQFFKTDGAGQAMLILRTILESEGNGAPALIEPIVSAVSRCLHPAWTAKGLEFIEAFDQLPMLSILETMRNLDLFRESELGWHLGIVLTNKLAKIFPPADRVAPAKVEKPPKPPLRLSLVERRMKIGAALRDLRKRHRCNKSYGRVRSKQFADLNSIDAAEYARVAGVYFDRPEIWQPGKVAWKILVMMASASMPAAVRQSLEQRILAGQRVTAPDVRAALAAYRRPSRRMAA